MLVNGRSGDPALYIEPLFEKRAILFDLGDIHSLPARKIIRLEQVFVSHTHIDHFVGFDRLLRVLVGREKTIQLFGPEGLVDSVGHKLHAYRWNLVDRFLCDLVFVAAELDGSRQTRKTRFRLKNAFRAEELDPDRLAEGVCHQDPHFRICMALLDHRTPCLGYAFEEGAHVNIWKNRLPELGLRVGPWLRELKQAVVERRPDDAIVRVETQRPAMQETRLGDLRDVYTVTEGQKIGYVTDAAPTEENQRRIIRLVNGADILFIEAPFAAADADLAAERAHLTTALAGRIARDAAVKRVEPFHFSPRYEGQFDAMLAEVANAYAGVACDEGRSRESAPTIEGRGSTRSGRCL
jgi:ribonuclease Z